jgi:hypothetical protein
MDATSTLIAWSGDRRELILPHLKLGLCAPLDWGALTILPAIDIHTQFEDRGKAAQLYWGRTSMDFHGGLEVLFKKRIAIRAGLDAGQFTAGAGLQISAFNIDYGFSHHRALGSTNRISLTFLLDRKRLKSI